MFFSSLVLQLLETYQGTVKIDHDIIRLISIIQIFTIVSSLLCVFLLMPEKGWHTFVLALESIFFPEIVLLVQGFRMIIQS